MFDQWFAKLLQLKLGFWWVTRLQFCRCNDGMNSFPGCLAESVHSMPPTGCVAKSFCSHAFLTWATCPPIDLHYGIESSNRVLKMLTMFRVAQCVIPPRIRQASVISSGPPILLVISTRPQSQQYGATCPVIQFNVSGRQVIDQTRNQTYIYHNRPQNRSESFEKSANWPLFPRRKTPAFWSATRLVHRQSPSGTHRAPSDSALWGIPWWIHQRQGLSCGTMPLQKLVEKHG